jgi:GNAT superfamily N-acetyltransferase
MIAPAGIALTLAVEPDPATAEAIGEALAAYNEAEAGPAESRPLWIIARDGEGRLAGGLRGQTFWHWLFVAWLWVDEAQRGRGLGAALLRAAEDEARKRGCIGAYVDTYSFQAPGFYARQGYAAFGRLEDLPPGGSRTWFAKRL